MKRSKETSQEDAAIIQARNEGGCIRQVAGLN